jgi:retron-type reverse transcriptase
VTHQRDDSAFEAVLTKQEQIAYRAKHHPQEAFTSLGHNLTRQWLETAYHRTRKDGAVGIDGITSQEYANSLEENLERLSGQARSGRYHAPPVRPTACPQCQAPMEFERRVQGARPTYGRGIQQERGTP